MFLLKHSKTTPPKRPQIIFKACFFTTIPRTQVLRNFKFSKIYPIEVGFLILPLVGGFEIPSKYIDNGTPGILNGHLRLFRGLEFGILVKEAWHFKCRGIRYHIISKKLEHVKSMFGILVNKQAFENSRIPVCLYFVKFQDAQV